MRMINKEELKELLEEWRECKWVCCENKDKNIKPCHFDQHGKDIVKEIMDFFEENYGFQAKSEPNHSQLPNETTRCREKGVKANKCLLELDNGSPADTQSTREQCEEELKKDYDNENTGL